MQMPVAGAAGGLAALGGYALAGVASIAVCVGAAAPAATLPDTRPVGRARGALGEGAGLATLRAGLDEVAGSARVRGAVLAVAALAALGSQAASIPLFATWAACGLPVVVAVLAVAAAGVPRLLGGPASATGRRR